MKHVILGNGPTGVVAAETIRKKRPGDEIVIVGDEHERPYSRMAIPYLLEGKIAESGTLLRHDRNHWEKARIGLVEARATAVDGQARTVTLSNGETLAWDTLLLATGSKPVRPPIPGMDLPDVVSCWTLEDARAILSRLRPGARVLQMGAGFIGCIIMEAIATTVGKTGGSLTVVEMGDRMVPRMMTPMASRLIRAWSEKAGVEILTSTRVTGIEVNRPPGGLMSPVAKAKLHPHHVLVSFGDGEKRAFDFVICATGVAPAIDYLKGSGVEIGSLGGIVVSKSLRIGGDKFDEAIMRYLRKQYSLAIGEQTAENLKIMIGTCVPTEEEMTMILKGRDLVQGLPRQIEVSSSCVSMAIGEMVQTLVDGVRNVLELTPPELSADIIDRGIVLTGGGSLLRGLPELISEQTGINCFVAEEPMESVARGTGKALAEIDKLNRLGRSGILATSRKGRKWKS